VIYKVQESLADANVSARQPSPYLAKKSTANQRYAISHWRSIDCRPNRGRMPLSPQKREARGYCVVKIA